MIFAIKTIIASDFLCCFRRQSREVRSIMKTTGIWWSNPEGLVQNRTMRFTTDRRRHLMSVITMLGPSPDWCVGECFTFLIFAFCTFAIQSFALKCF